MKNQRKLRNYLIKHKMQIRITAEFVFFALISSLLSGTMVYLTLWPTLSRLSTVDIFPILQANFVFILFWNSVPLVLVISVAGIIITHRVAGPVFNIENKLDKAIRGEGIELIRLRKHDELHELEEKINILFQKLKESEHPNP
ncbi:MAG: hypothetical protein GY861_21870 [bacterium]|nr:hypothetical protein [bacterium]